MAIKTYANVWGNPFFFLICNADLTKLYSMLVRLSATIIQFIVQFKTSLKMKNETYDSLVEFELPNEEMKNVVGGSNTGYCGGHIWRGCWCSGDVGNTQTQFIYRHTGCESLETGASVGYNGC